MAEITYLRRKEIDSTRWDRCILGAKNSVAYALSSYLDALCDGQWDALVAGDYEAVFPLPWRKKWGISYIYMPFFCQQLGVFSATEIWNQDAFIRAIPRHFRLIHLQLNPSFPFALPCKKRSNYVLHLQHSFETLCNHFNADAQKNLRKLDQLLIQYNTQISVAEVIDVYRQAWGESNPNIHTADYARFEIACTQMAEEGQVWTLGAYREQELLGAALFLVSPRFVHYVCAGPTAAGRSVGIMHGIIREAIRRYANTPVYLDFEGSEIPGVAKFYQKFGPENRPYFSYTENRLPRLLRRLKSGY
ncbi:MAG: GNAT family N-acetyltransferase [Bacteroidetes bacterium]|nr:GNAT family N-acetyltransferase [Bacteroidota bacterium]